jgi:hypothetical protein
MILHNIKPTMKRKKARIMRHSTYIASDIPRNLTTFRAETNMNLYSPDKLIALPMLYILADKTAQANVMH